MDARCASPFTVTAPIKIQGKVSKAAIKSPPWFINIVRLGYTASIVEPRIRIDSGTWIIALLNVRAAARRFGSLTPTSL
jgi:hypothetical protein